MQEKRENVYPEQDCMSLDGFCTYVRLGMEKKLGKNYKVFVEKVYKNNLSLQGLHVVEEGSQVSPIIYLDAFYERYQEKPELLEELEEEILVFYKNHKTCSYMNLEIAHFQDWEQVKSSICFKLIHKEQNKERLAQIPHIEMLDLAIVFYCLVDKNPETQASIMVEKQLMNCWEKSVDDLYAIAKENTPRLFPYEFEDMDKVLADLMEISIDFLREMLPKRKALKQYVLSNTTKLNGAASILYDGVLKKIANKLGSDLIIIPSSVHEVLLIKDDGTFAISDITEMVKEVNAKEVEPDEVLSDHAYRYVRNLDKVIM